MHLLVILLDHKVNVPLVSSFPLASVIALLPLGVAHAEGLTDLLQRTALATGRAVVSHRCANTQVLEMQTAPASGESHPVNSAFLSPPKEYIHRVGRTARGLNGRGHALLILRPEELGFLRYLKQSKVKVFA